ncbi:helix-turn-helix transcriptional regulator [Streptomyces sp. NPDC004647]|uniref:helix-turn-helix domain-containing protein n=1 Tax=Streptomyces sp. NPDC004647 TaxID=3154671 RepID=UPI0033BBACCC
MARAERRGTASATAQYFAEMVRTLREQAGLTQEEVGKRINYTGAAISALENCKQLPGEKMLAGLEDVLGGGAGLLQMAGKYLVLDRYPPYFKDYVLLEAAALNVSSYQTLVIDGLFQTEEYARAVLRCGFPPRNEEEVGQLADARMDRKALFDRKPVPLIELVLEESALRRQIGTHEVMRAQLAHLAECAARRNVTVQVIPLNRGARGEHAGLDGPMKLIETPEHHHLVYLESQRKSLLISDREEVSALATRYAMIRAQALGPDESLDLIERLAGER